jgi:hypothetical protein
LVRGRADLAWAPPAWSLAAALVAVRGARQVAAADIFPILARFGEAEVPPPYREDGLPERTRGEGLARLLPATARPYFLRDLRQLRRRYRLDRILLWVYGLALARLNLVAEGPGAPALANLAALALTVGLLLVSGFRTHGPELASPWLARTLPLDRAALRLGRLAADLIYPAWAWALTVVAAALAGGPAAGLVVAGAGAVLVAALVAASQLLAARAFPDRVTLAALAWRAGVLSALGVLLWQR